MSDRDVKLEALSILCNATVTSLQSQSVVVGASAGNFLSSTMTIPGFISALMGRAGPNLLSAARSPQSRGGCIIIDEEEFFDPEYDYDFTDLQDTETFYRGGEVYERPCGWKRYALKVLDKYPDGNAWLGERGHCTTTESKPGEWPVSYHGTSKIGARGIIVSRYVPGAGQDYGRGIYSTPFISEAEPYTKTFTSTSTGSRYHVVLQNRVNPKYREKYNDDKYWLVPLSDSLSKEEEQDIVDKAIRPYALLVRRL
ncbi:uncharacterized protein LOC108893845 isoform X2 [Lates japonicus]